jgi:hypothetical protein
MLLMPRRDSRRFKVPFKRFEMRLPDEVTKEVSPTAPSSDHCTWQLAARQRFRTEVSPPFVRTMYQFPSGNSWFKFTPPSAQRDTR